MNRHVWVVLICTSLLVACSEGDKEPVLNETDGSIQQSSNQMAQTEEPAQGEAQDLDCPGFESLFALLPDQLSNEALSEQYFSCDPIPPKASSHFTSADQNTLWTFSVTARELDSTPARLQWDLGSADESQKAYLRKGIKADIDGEVLLFDICVDYLGKSGLPDWQKTSRANTERHDICVGSDAQIIEEGRWVARATSPEYIYTIELEGEKAAQFGSAQEASSYFEALFRNFR